MATRKIIYFDYHATTPLAEEARKAMEPYLLEKFGNPSSEQHRLGWDAQFAVHKARSQVADLLSLDPDLILFTSGATESLHLALTGWTRHLLKTQKQCHIVTTNIEHKATYAALELTQEFGGRKTIVPVSPLGHLEVEKLNSLFLNDPFQILTVIHGHNEIGTLQNLASLSQFCNERQILFHIDAAQSFGKVLAPFALADGISISGHKIYGPKGVGALALSKKGKASLVALFGGSQEFALRGGTQNVPGIVGLGEAAVLAKASLPQESLRLEKWRDHLQTEILCLFPEALVHGDAASRLPNNLSLSLPSISAEKLAMSLRSFAWSTGSACNSLNFESNHVLTALNVPFEMQKKTLRLSLGRPTTEEEVAQLIEAFKAMD